MPKVKNPELEIAVEIAVKKFHLREMLFFFREMRKKVIGDGPFYFTSEDFSNYISNMEFSKVMGIYINDEHIKTDLKILKDSFYKRDNNLKIIRDNRGLIKLLDYSIENKNNKKIFHVKNITKDDIENIIRFIDIYLNLRKDYKTEDEFERKIESLNNNESFFGQTEDHRLTFCNKESDINLEGKGKAILNILKKHFKEYVRYDDIYNQFVTERGNRGTDTIPTKRKEFVNNGVTELKMKLFKISGNPETIITKGERTSEYKLIY